MKVLGIDFGLARIGLAVGTVDSGVAFPRDPLLNDDQLYSHLEAFITHEGIDRIVVGNPLKRDGSPGDIHGPLQVFLDELARFSKDIEVFDERYTSKIAHMKLHTVGVKMRDQRALIDSTAAQVLLQEWMDQHRPAMES